MPDWDKRRAVLEGIAYSGDSTETARMRALELLGELDRREAAERAPVVPPTPI